jgi:hypothetical protein
MNNVAVTPHICLHALQLQNVKRDVAKKISIDELNVKEQEQERKGQEEEPDGTNIANIDE